MIVQFICRGNAFRSIIAEAYLKSLQLDNVKVISSGTVAAKYKAINEDRYISIISLLERHHIQKFAKKHYGDPINPEQVAQADLAVCMNQLVYDEADRICKLPEHTIVWDVTDIGETGRIARSTEEQRKFEEDAFAQITQNVNQLVQSLGLRQKAYQSSPATLN